MNDRAQTHGPQIVNLADFEHAARQRMDRGAFDYVAGGAGDELSIQRNHSAWREIELWPRAGVDVSNIKTTTSLLGHDLDHPIILAPTAYASLAHPDAEAPVARAASNTAAVHVASSFASLPIEEIRGAAGAGQTWFQLYIQKDRSFTRHLIERVASAGCSALVITVDTPLLGPRDRESRTFGERPDLRRPNLDGLEGIETSGAHRTGEGALYSDVHDASVDWDDLAGIINDAPLPVLLKGIMHPDDAEHAIRSGASGIIVSNHGGRNLDSAPATAHALPGIVRRAAAIDRSIPVLIDGGLRRGEDVLKALALGARAVLIGRPYVYALAADGQSGVERCVRMLHRELTMAMALCGTVSIEQIRPRVLREL